MRSWPDGAPGDRGDLPGEHPGDVGDRLAAADVRLGGVDLKRQAAELGDADGERDPGAQARLVEEQRDRLRPGKRAERPDGPPSSPSARSSTWACSAGVRSSSRRKCLAMLHAFCSSCSWAWVRMAGSAATNSGASAWVRISGGASRTASGCTALTRKPACRAAALTAGALSCGEHGGEPQAAAADAREQRVVDGRDAAGQRLADRLDVLQHVIALDRVEDREGRGAGDRVAAEGGAVVAGHERGCPPRRSRRTRRSAGRRRGPWRASSRPG